MTVLQRACWEPADPHLFLGIFLMCNNFLRFVRGPAKIHGHDERTGMGWLGAASDRIRARLLLLLLRIACDDTASSGWFPTVVDLIDSCGVVSFEYSTRFNRHPSASHAALDPRCVWDDRFV